jgi:hypothetical protein
MLVAGSAQAGLASAFRIVLQKGRHFDPTDLFLRRGDTITLVNGDDNVVHHAFIEADRFAFDAGDQEPGKQATLVHPHFWCWRVIEGWRVELHPLLAVDHAT